MIEVRVRDSFYEAGSPFQAFAFLTALELHGFEEGYAREIAELCYDLYNDFQYAHPIELIDYVCENYNELPNSYDEIHDMISKERSL